MSNYWFYDTSPSHVVSESELTNKQKEIIHTETSRITKDNYNLFWVGYRQKNGWKFMRNGLEVIETDELETTKARNKLEEILKKKYSNIF